MAEEPINHPRATMPASAQPRSIERDDAVLELVEERLNVDKRIVAGGTVRVSTRTETHDELAEVTLDRAEVDVERVPVDRAIDAVPPVRYDGDTMIVPVIEERLVVTKQLFLIEELHIHQRVVQQTVTSSVPLRRQHAVVERIDAEGQALPMGPPTTNR